MKRKLILTAVVLTTLVSGSVIARHHGDDNPFRRDILHSKMAERLELSDTQKAQIQAVLDQNGDSNGSRKAAYVETHHQLTELVQTTEGFDEEKAREIIKTQQADELEHKLSSLSTRHQIWNLLTAEQQQKMQEMTQRRGKGQRHRS